MRAAAEGTPDVLSVLEEGAAGSSGGSVDDGDAGAASGRSRCTCGGASARGGADSERSITPADAPKAARSTPITTMLPNALLRAARTARMAT